jgi:hypothetical protein
MRSGKAGPGKKRQPDLAFDPRTGGTGAAYARHPPGGGNGSSQPRLVPWAA